nr:MAG TPA: hypothetical protein [Caudoviricetes sp.]
MDALEPARDDLEQKSRKYPSAKLKRLYGPVNDSSGDISPDDFLFLQKKIKLSIIREL